MAKPTNCPRFGPFGLANEESAVTLPVLPAPCVRQPTVTNEPLFVQNEEQKESDLWTKTAISKEEYFETSAAVNLDPYNDAPHPEIVEYIELVKSKKMALRDVPQEFIMAVKARI